MVALPFPSAVTRPLVEALATADELVDQAKLTWDVTSPNLGFEAVAASCRVWLKLLSEVLPEAVTTIVSTYTAAESIVIWPPALDDKDPMVATALTIEPFAALEETAARPSAPMDAIAGLFVVHTGAGAPATALSRASIPVAWKSGVSPGGTRIDEGVTSTFAATWVTATSSVASLVPADAWMVVVPFAIAVTSPPCVTVATAGLPLVKATPTPAIATPFASSATAASWTVSPRLVRGPVREAVNDTDATAGGAAPPPPQAIISIAIAGTQPTRERGIKSFLLRRYHPSAPVLVVHAARLIGITR